MPDTVETNPVDEDRIRMVASQLRRGEVDIDELSNEIIERLPRDKEFLSDLRVTQLRKMCRHDLEGGTWISHVPKRVLIKAIFEAEVPEEAHHQSRKQERLETGPMAAMPSFGDANAEREGEAFAQAAQSYVYALIEELVPEYVDQRFAAMLDSLDEITDENMPSIRALRENMQSGDELSAADRMKAILNEAAAETQKEQNETNAGSAMAE